MSALFRPYCGRAFGSFGIRTFSGRRPICASAAAGRPVSGQTLGFGVGVGVGGAVGLGGWVGVAVAVAVGEPTATGVAPPPPHEAATTAQTKRTTNARRATITVVKRIGKRRAKGACLVSISPVSTIRVVVEAGSKRVFASAVDWPGWARSGPDEGAALEALIAYAPRYAAVVSGTRLGFAVPAGATGLRVVERVPGNATTDFGAPGVPAKVDAAAVSAADLARMQTVLRAGWRAFDAGVDAARGKTLRKGPRGGGRALTAIVEHVREAEAGYLSGLGWPYKSSGTGRARLEGTRAAVLEGLAASVRGEIAAKGPRGGVRWKPRFFVRRLTWHALDHLWEIEDRSS